MPLTENQVLQNLGLVYLLYVEIDKQKFKGKINEYLVIMGEDLNSVLLDEYNLLQ